MTKTLVKQAITDIQNGKMVILVDDKDRENEGDLVIAAEKVTPEIINFMVTHARGLVCMPMMPADFERLDIPMMAKNNQSAFETGFGVSIGAAKGMSTGISAADRAHTVAVAANPNATEKDIVKPGHIFPLKGRNGGLFMRQGHTEASLDLVRLAGLGTSAVICEIMNADGSMARELDLLAFAKKHQLTILPIKDILDYRYQTEFVIEKITSTTLPTGKYPDMKMHLYKNKLDQSECVVLTQGAISKDAAPLVRLHSQCLTGDVFGSKRCDCGEQLEKARAQISSEGGILLYLPQEGRGIGLANKLKAYALQDQGFDTVEANHQLGFKADEREYFIAAEILKHLGVSKVRLLTNNPKKITGLTQYGIAVQERVPLFVEPCLENSRYLKTKQDKLGHYLTLEQVINE